MKIRWSFSSLPFSSDYVPKGNHFLTSLLSQQSATLPITQTWEAKWTHSCPHPFRTNCCSSLWSLLFHSFQPRSLSSAWVSLAQVFGFPICFTWRYFHFITISFWTLAHLCYFLEPRLSMLALAFTRWSHISSLAPSQTPWNVGSFPSSVFRAGSFQQPEIPLFPLSWPTRNSIHPLRFNA